MAEQLRCPDCNTPLRQIDTRPGKETWACPVAMEAQRRELLGKPGRKHKMVKLFVKRIPVEEKTNV